MHLDRRYADCPTTWLVYGPRWLQSGQDRVSSSALASSLLIRDGAHRDPPHARYRIHSSTTTGQWSESFSQTALSAWR